jgi:hypothetical protein
MPLYNVNENLIEGGGDIIQLYNKKSVINFVTTGSNRVVLNIEKNPFCSGMTLEWCKSQSFPSGTITSSAINCNESLLQPLVNYVGYTQFMGNYGVNAIDDNGNYFLRVSQSNIPYPLQYLTQSQYSNVVPISINKQCCALQTSSVNNVTRYDATQTITAQIGSWLPFGFNSSSQVWYNGAQIIAGPNKTPSDIFGGLAYSTGSVRKVGNTPGAAMNNEIFSFTYAQDGSSQPIGGIWFDTTNVQSEWAVSLIFNSGTLDIGSVNDTTGSVTSANRFFSINTNTISGRVVGNQTPTFTLSTGSFYNQHVYVSKLVGQLGAQIYLNGALVGGVNAATGSGRYIKFIQNENTSTDIRFIGTRQINTDTAASASLQYNTLTASFNS